MASTETAVPRAVRGETVVLAVSPHAPAVTSDHALGRGSRGRASVMDVLSGTMELRVETGVGD